MIVTTLKKTTQATSASLNLPYWRTLLTLGLMTNRFPIDEGSQRGAMSTEIEAHVSVIIYSHEDC